MRRGGVWGRSRTSMAPSYVDYGKILCILGVTLFIFYTALNKFVISGMFTQTSKPMTVSITPNYNVCHAVGTSTLVPPADRSAFVAQCRTDISSIYDTAQTECKQYLKQMNACLKAESGNCRAQESTLESCVDAIIMTTVRKWNGIATHGPSSKLENSAAQKD